MEKSHSIGNTIKALRRQRNISQEVLAAALGVSIQAVSKWETGASLPDILMLPGIAQFFGVTIDFLFTGERQHAEISMPLLPDDGCLRLVQFLGRRCLSREQIDPTRLIPLDVTHLPRDQVWNVEIWGSADIKGQVGGSVKAGDGVNCGPVGGNVSAGDGVNCGPVGGNVSADDGVNCGPVGGNVSADEGINCGDVGGNVSAGEDINCGDIGGSISAGEDVQCGNVGGGIHSGGEVKCGDIDGSVDAQGDVRCNNILHAEHISCENIVCKEGHIHCNNITTS